MSPRSWRLSDMPPNPANLGTIAFVSRDLYVPERASRFTGVVTQVRLFTENTRRREEKDAREFITSTIHDEMLSRR